MTDIVTTAISAYFIGTLADKYGRKLLCMVYCVSYALSCFLTVVPATPLLYLGRVLGGLSSSILFTVFESWMVTGFHEGRLDKEGCDLSRTFAATGAVNGFVAIWSGLVGEVLVWATGTKKSPFLLSVGLLWLALQAIWSSWVGVALALPCLMRIRMADHILRRPRISASELRRSERVL